MASHVSSSGSACSGSRLISAAALFTFSVNLATVGFGNEFANTPADVSEASRLKLRSNRVIVFKDGYCLVVKQASGTTDGNGHVFTDEVPDAAVLGSFWAVPEQGNIKQTVAGWVDAEKVTSREVNCSNILEIVQSNLGKECSFLVGEQRIEGTLLKLLSNKNGAIEGQSPPDFPLDSSITASVSTRLASSNATTLSFDKAAFFLVRTRMGDKVIHASSVIDLTIINMNSTIEQQTTTKTRSKRLTMKFSEPNMNVKLNLMYFRPDVRWIPTYRVNLTGKSVAYKKGDADGAADDRKAAELTLQGEIINEAEDFVDVPFHVVVGVPNFRYRSVPSPMVLEATMRHVLHQAAPGIMGIDNNSFSNALYSQRAGEFRVNQAASAPGEADLPDELVGKGGNDLFIYELPPMSLQRGERALVPILRSEVGYRDIYTWNIELTHSESYATTSADSPSPLVLSEAKIWRQIELINSTALPWTTGAVMLVDGRQPLAQELLTYTSPGGTCRVPVTVSVDLRGKAEDTETKRSYSAVQWRGNNYARIEGKIEAELVNGKSASIPVEVQLRFGGKALKVSDGATIRLEAFRAADWSDNRGDSINNSSHVRWITTIAPGQSFKPVVHYEFMLRH